MVAPPVDLIGECEPEVISAINVFPPPRPTVAPENVCPAPMIRAVPLKFIAPLMASEAGPAPGSAASSGSYRR